MLEALNRSINIENKKLNKMKDSYENMTTTNSVDILCNPKIYENYKEDTIKFKSLKKMIIINII